jgi:IS4 transposase
MVMTGLLETGAELIPRRYRFRRRIELVFKRLKSLFGDNRIPSKVEASAKAQVYGKLLLAAFCETGANKARFSP